VPYEALAKSGFGGRGPPPKMRAMWYVYQLKCADKKHYTGFSGSVHERVKAHERGEVHFTKSRLPVELVSYFAFKNKQLAYDFERYLKSRSGIAFANKRLRAF